MSKTKIKVPNKDDPSQVDFHFLKKLQSDPNSWHILKEGDEEEPQRKRLNKKSPLSVLEGDETEKV